MHLKKTAACPRTMLVGSLSSTVAGFDIFSLQARSVAAAPSTSNSKPPSWGSISPVVLEVGVLQDELLVRLLELRQLLHLPLGPGHILLLHHLHALLLGHLDADRQLHHVLLPPALHAEVVDVHGAEELLVDVLRGGCRHCSQG